jgi:hypothetical protein
MPTWQYKSVKDEQTKSEKLYSIQTRMIGSVQGVNGQRCSRNSTISKNISRLNLKTDANTAKRAPARNTSPAIEYPDRISASRGLSIAEAAENEIPAIIAENPAIPYLIVTLALASGSPTGAKILKSTSNEIGNKSNCNMPSSRRRFISWNDVGLDAAHFKPLCLE